MRHRLKLPIIVVSMFLVGYFLEVAIVEYGVSRSVENTIEILSELFSAFVAISIFSITWYAYSKSKDNHSLFLGAGFFIVGSLIIFHVLSYPFMPGFITPNSYHKSMFFLIGSRLVLGVLVLASAYIHEDTLPRLINKRLMIFFIIIIPGIVLYSVLKYHDSILVGFGPASGLSIETLLLMSVPTALLLSGCYLYARRLRQTGQLSLIFLLYGSIIIIFSNMIYFYYEFSGHFLIIAGFYFFFLALYKSSIELPYEKLAMAEERLRHVAEDKYRSVIYNANDAIIATDREDAITSWNKAAEKLFGWKKEEVMGKKLSPLIVPDDIRKYREQFVSNVMSITVIGIETVCLHKSGSRIDVSMTISRILDTEGELTGISCIFRDIRERKQAEERIKQSLKEKEILLREIHHRVKNNMQIVSSLLWLQSERIKEKEYLEMLRDSQSRIKSMSLIHEKLYRSKDLEKIDFNEYITDLSNSLFQSYGIKGNIALHINVENVLLGIDSAIPCGLIINELITNSLKYAFPHGRKGEIKVSLCINDENMVELVVGDNGVGIPEDVDFRKTESLGLHLITMLTEDQLQGDISLDRSKGTEFKIKFKDGRK